METILIIGSIILIAITVMLIVYPLLSKKGDTVSNLYFSLLVLLLAFQSAKYIMLVFSTENSEFAFNLWLIGLIGTGPLFYLFSNSYTKSEKGFARKDLFHLITIIVFITLWLTAASIHADYRMWNLYHRSFMLVNIAYLSFSLYKLNGLVNGNMKLRKQLEAIGILLCFLWFSQFLNEVSGMRYLSGTVLFGFMIYMTIRIWINKGLVIDITTSKYQKTGLKEEEKHRIIKELDILLTKDKIFISNTLSISKVAREINTNVHALSQVINENYHHSFFDLISKNRIAEAKILLKKDSKTKISDIAYEVGYNSLSAFNTAFKKQTGITPTQYRNGT